MRKPLLNSNQIAKIVQQISAGKNLHAVAMNYKISRNSLVNNLKRNGYAELTVSTSPYRKAISPEQIEQAKQLMAGGMSQSSAARAIGFTPQALCTRLKGAGRPKKATALKRATNDQDAAAMKAHVALNSRFLSMPMRVGA